MGATASINATSKKYKPSEPIEVKFNHVVKYDDGDVKPFKDGLQLETKKLQPLSLLASAIRMLERKPREDSVSNGYFPNNYSRQVRPRSAYMVLKKGPHSSSALNMSNKNGIPQNGLYPKLSPQQKQLKTKQNLYMSLINPNGTTKKEYTFPHNGMTVPHKTRPPSRVQLNYEQNKSNTLPRYNRTDGKQLKVNRRLYMDMIHPVMTSPQYFKLSSGRRIPETPSSLRTISGQSHCSQNLSPRPPNESHILNKKKPPSRQRVIYTPQTEKYTPQRRAISVQRKTSSENNSSVGSDFLPHKQLHLPWLTRKTRDEVSLNCSLNSQTSGEIPRGHPDNVIPLYFRKSLAYSPQYKHKQLLSNPL